MRFLAYNPYTYNKPLEWTAKNAATQLSRYESYVDGRKMAGYSVERGKAIGQE